MYLTEPEADLGDTFWNLGMHNISGGDNYDEDPIYRESGGSQGRLVKNQFQLSETDRELLPDEKRPDSSRWDYTYMYITDQNGEVSVSKVRGSDNADRKQVLCSSGSRHDRCLEEKLYAGC